LEAEDPNIAKFAGGEASFNSQFCQVFTAMLSTHGNEAKAGIARLISDGVERVLKMYARMETSLDIKQILKKLILEQMWVHQIGTDK
jgi:hypothetical protein